MSSYQSSNNIFISVVKATGTFYPSSHLRSNASSPSPRSIYDASPSKDMKLRMDYDQKKPIDQKPTGPTIPPSCHDQNCSLNKNAGGMNLHYHCPHCGQAYVDLKLLFSHMVKKHSNAMDSGPVGLAATKVSKSISLINSLFVPIKYQYYYITFKVLLDFSINNNRIKTSKSIP